MFARTLELMVKAEKKPELIKKAKADILPVLHKQIGFAHVFALENEVELNKALVVTLWHTKMDAERYERETFLKIKQILEPFLVAPPVVKFYNVEETISEKLISTMAA
jgi:heme-degrading monooxygenase HmoA